MKLQRVLSICLLSVVVGGLSERASFAQPDSTDVDFPPRLLPLVDQLEVSIRLTYRFSPMLYHRRIEDAVQVVGRWRQSHRTPADEQKLEKWFVEANRLSAPRLAHPFPPPPEFTRANESSLPTTPSREQPQQARRDSQTARAPNPPRTEDSASKTNVTPPSSQPDGMSSEPVARNHTVRRSPTVTRVPADEDPGQSNTDQPSETVPSLQSDPFDSVLVSSFDPTSAPANAGQEKHVVRRPRVTVNLAELNSRLAGLRMAQQRLESRLISAPTDVAELARLVGELDRIAEQRRLLDLYMDIVPLQERQLIDRPGAISDAIAKLKGIIATRQESMQGSRTKEADILQALVIRLASLNGEAELTPQDERLFFD